MSKYDGLYIFTSAVKDEALDKQVEKAVAEIVRLNGTVLETTTIGRKTFAHPMHKKDSGVYVKVRFEIEPSQIAVLVNRYHLTGDVFRVMFTTVDDRREAKLAEQAKIRAEREAAKEEARANAEAEAETVAPAPAEEVNV